MQKISHTLHSTARIFLIKNFVKSHQNQNIIISDNTSDIEIFENIGHKIFPNTPIYIVKNIGEIFWLEKEKTGIFVIHTDMFRVEGNWYHIQKKENIFIERNVNISQENLIEMLLEKGYSYDPYQKNIFSYKKEWPIITIIGAKIDTHYMVEWFDTEIDAIIVHQKNNWERNFVDNVTLSHNTKICENKENIEKPKINEGIVENLKKIFTNAKIVISCCDFLQEFYTIAKICDIHLSEISSPESVNANICNIEIQNISELLDFLKNFSHPENIIFWTRHKASIENFLSDNNITHWDIREENYRKISSFYTTENSLHIEKNIAVISDDILSKIFVKNRKSRSVAKNLDLLISLLPWDFVVHRDHGIAKFEAIVKKKVGELEREYLELHYAENDKLFVPITEIFRISKYLWNDDVTLTRLGGKEWEKTLNKTDEELQIIAENILETNAKRQISVGRAFWKFEEQEKKFREKFPYEYTEDQYNGIMDVFADMEAEIPMDRLLSGDVGFGKTEIAMNAVYKAFLSGSQVAIISPLVVLAMEHYESFIERLGDFGVKIALLTRMNAPKEVEKIISDIKTGRVDVVIGTHKLLSDDIKWKKIWLLIVDEEHKFGVIHKEKIKKIRAWIDILSLSATPIPRSLNLALSGLRQISLLSTPPKKKKPIETIITSWNENIIKTAIEREFSRNGQVIIIHNRIKGIDSLKQELEEILDDSAKIIITHGRMTGDEIENRIHDFKEKKYNILLTTTIIENGVNFLSSNTIIIIDPEEFWLASLHQLRGRVGRRGEQWYCYLTYRKISLSNEEKDRLITIANNNHLGAGFEIAMRDMEIRGAGDILGIKQSGKSKEIGLPLYFRMLEEKISELKNEKSQKIFTKIELELSYILSDSYFSSELDKLNFFREAENIDTLEELDFFKNSFTNADDSHLENFFLLLEARLIFGTFGVEKISKNGNFYVFDFKKWNSVDNLKKFLDIFDPEKNFIVVTMEKIRIDSKIFWWPKDFLQKITKKH